MPKVTVAMPVYNDAAYLKEAVDSILAQTFRDFELLVIDDGSTDGSASIIAEYADSRIRCIPFAENKGRPVARNAALDNARGEYLAWMDADDIARRSGWKNRSVFLTRSRIWRCAAHGSRVFRTRTGKCVF